MIRIEFGPQAAEITPLSNTHIVSMHLGNDNPKAAYSVIRNLAKIEDVDLCLYLLLNYLLKTSHKDMVDLMDVILSKYGKAFSQRVNTSMFHCLYRRYFVLCIR